MTRAASLAIRARVCALSSSRLLVGLVEHEQFRLRHDCAGQQHTLELSSGKLSYQVLLESRQPNLAQGVKRFRSMGGSVGEKRFRFCIEAGANRFEHGCREATVVRRRLLRDVAYVLP